MQLADGFESCAQVENGCLPDFETQNDFVTYASAASADQSAPHKKDGGTAIVGVAMLLAAAAAANFW